MREKRPAREKEKGKNKWSKGDESGMTGFLGRGKKKGSQSRKKEESQLTTKMVTGGGPSKKRNGPL